MGRVAALSLRIGAVGVTGRVVEIEINASDDDPLFDVGSGRAQSGGNFYGSRVTRAMDSLKIAVANLCDLMDRQLEGPLHRPRRR